MSRNYAYVRVSAKDQNTDRQMKVMNELGIKEEYTFTDKASGKNFDRPEYKLLKRCLHEGDVVFVKSLDRFGRNKEEILKEWQWLMDNKVDIVVTDMPLLDTRKYKDMEGVGKLVTDLVLQILSWLAEEERNNIKQRQAEGIKIAKQNKVKFGRPRLEANVEFEKAYQQWKAGEITAVKAMQLLDMKPNTFYRRVKEHEGKGI